MEMSDEEKEALLRFMRSTATLSATVKKLSTTVDSLAAVLVATQEELAGVRLVAQAVFGVLSDQGDEFAHAVARVMEADTTHMLNTPVSDHSQEQRRAWMLRLLPPRTLHVLRQQYPHLQLPASP